MSDVSDQPGGTVEFEIRHDFERYCAERLDELRQVVARLCRQNPQLAEDVLQETLIAARRHWDAVGLFDHPMKWLVRAAYNQARAANRAAWRENSRTVSLDGLELQAPAESATDADALHLLRRLVVGLPKRQAQILHLRFDGWTVRDIGLHLGIAPETVRGHLAEARRNLRARLAHEQALAEAS